MRFPMRLLLLAFALASAASAQPVPDAAFSLDGFALPGPAAESDGLGVALDAQGRVLVVGRYQDPAQPDAGYIARLRPDGTPDTTIRVLATSFPAASGEQILSARPIRVAATPDGRIAVAGFLFSQIGTQVRFEQFVAVYRGGALDPAFGTGGVTRFAGRQPWALAATPAGLVVASVSAGNVGVARLLRFTYAGAPDPTFSGDGVFEGAAGSGILDLAVRADGRLVAVGYATPAAGAPLEDGGDLYVLALTAAGEPDATFSGDGVLTEDLFGETEAALGVTVLPDGRVLVSGLASKRTGTEYGTAVMLVRADGTPEMGFGFEGWTWTNAVRTPGTTGTDEIPSRPYALADGSFGVLATGLPGAPAGLVSVGLDAGGNPLAAYGPAGVAPLFPDQPGLAFDAGGGSGLVAGGRLYVVGTQTVAGAPSRAFVARLAAPTLTGTADVAAARAALAVAPNPVVRAARVTLTLAETAHATVRVLDALGRTVAVLADHTLAAGPHTLTLDAARLPAGVYAVVATVGGAQSVTRVTVVR